MHEKDKADFRELIRESFSNRRDIDEVTHIEHHKWTKAKIQKEKEMAEFWAAMRTHLAKWGMLGVASWIFYALWYYFKHSINGGS